MSVPNTEILSPAICCVGYNRPASMRRLLRSIKKGVYNRNDIPLIISIDESPKSDEVEAVAREFQWDYGEKTIRRFPERLGLRKHVLLCGDLSIEYGSVICLEDDVVVAPGFYNYTLQALEYYQSDPKIFGVALNCPKWVGTIGCEFIPAYNGNDAYFLKIDISRGQCWFRDQWLAFKEWFEKTENKLPTENREIPLSVLRWSEKTSWCKYLSFYLVEQDLYHAVPYFSFSTNMGEVGSHTTIQSDLCQVPLSECNTKRYQFCRLDEGVAYDSFSERIDPFFKELQGIPFSEICMDLNGKKYDFGEYRYVLTTQNLKYELIAEYGVNMEPIEENIIFDVRGKGLALYQIPPHTVVRPDLSIGKWRLMHVLSRYPAKSLARVIVLKIRRRIRYYMQKNIR